VSYLEKLKGAKNRKDLARILGFRPSAMTAIVYKLPPALKYTTFDIPKKDGGSRTIKTPNPRLKKLQTHLTNCLYSCLEEIERGRISSPVSYGFRKNGTIVANAKNHVGRRYVLNLDIEDFFSSFNFGRVRGFFLKDNAFKLEEEVATTIAQIACDGTALPQGSPCSPVISELIGQILDLRLLRLAKKYGVRYSRYADDLTFSTNQRNFPTALAQQDGASPSDWSLGQELADKIVGAGFSINNSKTRMQYRGSRQMVTGLFVNEIVGVKCEYYRKARAMCDSLFQTGKYYKNVIPSTSPGGVPTPDFLENTNVLEGIISYIYYISQNQDRRKLAEQRSNPKAIRALYRRFLFYKYCIAPTMPLIITEGKTDPIYLREAIKQRKKYHPRLGSLEKDVFTFAVKFLNYEGTAHEIMDLGGGSGDLKSIPLDYRRNLEPTAKGRKPFGHKPMAHPVILVVDNDDGLSGIAATIKKVFNIPIDVGSTDKFYHIWEKALLNFEWAMRPAG
jgi:RNA-directed DNA polymerase